MHRHKNIIDGQKALPRVKRGGDFVFIRRFSRMGFTLLEMLVVIAVIAILFVLAFPVYSRVVDKAHSVTCQGNLRTISTALQAYVADHDGKLIPAVVYAYEEKGGSWYSPDKRIGGFWYTQLDPYINPGIDEEWNMRADKRDTWLPEMRAKYAKWQLCPAKKPKLMGYVDDYKTVGYGWNASYFGKTTAQKPDGSPSDSASTNGGEFSRMSQVEKPSSTVIIGDSKDAEDSYQAYQNQYLYESEMAGGVNIRPHRHSGGGNYLFLDGHIEWITPEQMNERVKSPERIFKKKKS